MASVSWRRRLRSNTRKRITEVVKGLGAGDWLFDPIQVVRWLRPGRVNCAFVAEAIVHIASRPLSAFTPRRPERNAG